MTVTMEFDLGERSEIELLRGSIDDSLEQLQRARRRLERAQRRVKNLEVASESWTQLLAQYERTMQSASRSRRGIASAASASDRSPDLVRDGDRAAA